MAIRMAIRSKNGMVVVFDEGGEQIPEYQGQYADVKERVLRDAASDAVFNHWFDHADRPQMVPKENW